MGRKKGISNGQNVQNKNDCDNCEGSGFYFGKECGACDGTGKELVRRQLQKVYNAKNKLPLSYNISNSNQADA